MTLKATTNTKTPPQSPATPLHARLAARSSKTRPAHPAPTSTPPQQARQAPTARLGTCQLTYRLLASILLLGRQADCRGGPDGVAARANPGGTGARTERRARAANGISKHQTGTDQGGARHPGQTRPTPGHCPHNQTRPTVADQHPKGEQTAPYLAPTTSKRPETQHPNNWDTGF
jgi:hypothetical protein